MGFGFTEAGNAIAGFFPKKAKTIYYNKPLRNTTEDFLRYLDQAHGQSDADIANFSGLLAKALPQAQALGADDASRMTAMLDTLKNYDPLGSYNRIRSGNISALTDFLPTVSGAGLSAADKVSAAMGGYGGRPGGAYLDKLAMAGVSRPAMQVLNTIFGNLGADSSGAETNRWNSILNSLGLMQQRADTPYRGVYQMLDPVTARNETLANETARLLNLTDATRGNIAGMQLKQSPWANFFQQTGKGADELAGKAASIFGGMMGGPAGAALGGMGDSGGMLGGLMGGGGGGGGGGVNLAQILQLVAAMRGGGAGGGPPGGGRNPGTFWLGPDAPAMDASFGGMA